MGGGAVNPTVGFVAESPSGELLHLDGSGVGVVRFRDHPWGWLEHGYDDEADVEERRGRFSTPLDRISATTSGLLASRRRGQFLVSTLSDRSPDLREFGAHRSP